MFIFLMAYMSYLTAEIFHFSGIIRFVSVFFFLDFYLSNHNPFGSIRQVYSCTFSCLVVIVSCFVVSLWNLTLKVTCHVNHTQLSNISWNFSGMFAFLFVFLLNGESQRIFFCRRKFSSNSFSWISLWILKIWCLWIFPISLNCERILHKILHFWPFMLNVDSEPSNLVLIIWKSILCQWIRLRTFYNHLIIFCFCFCFTF